MGFRNGVFCGGRIVPAYGEGGVSPVGSGFLCAGDLGEGKGEGGGGDGGREGQGGDTTQKARNVPDGNQLHAPGITTA